MKLSLEWLPLAFYDALGRVVPGVVIAWLATLTPLWYECVGPHFDLSKLTDLGTVPSMLLALTGSFVLGLVAGEPWRFIQEQRFYGVGLRQGFRQGFREAWRSILRKKPKGATTDDDWPWGKGIWQRKKWERFSELPESVSPLLSGQKNDFSDLCKDCPPYVMHDQIGLARPGEGAYVMKLRAEQRMSHALATGSIALFAANLVYHGWTKPAAGDTAIAVVLLLLFLTAVHHAHRLESYVTTLTCTSWLWLAVSGELFTSPRGERDVTKTPRHDARDGGLPAVSNERPEKGDRADPAGQSEGR